jgi:hypothetical protein
MGILPSRFARVRCRTSKLEGSIKSAPGINDRKRRLAPSLLVGKSLDRQEGQVRGELVISKDTLQCVCWKGVGSFVALAPERNLFLADPTKHCNNTDTSALFHEMTLLSSSGGALHEQGSESRFIAIVRNHGPATGCNRGYRHRHYFNPIMSRDNIA